MLIIVKYGVYKCRSHIFIRGDVIKMVIEDGKFYFIKDEFFDIFKDYGLMKTKMAEPKDHAIFVLGIEYYLQLGAIISLYY